MSKRRPVPESLLEQVTVPGAPPTARVRGDIATGRAFEERRRAVEAAAAQFARGRERGCQPVFLAISGGGSDGAFGAGLLKGWTEAGDRPPFLLVTGTSTGALSAPLAFLGSEYDDQLEAIYTLYATKDLLRKRPLWQALLSDAAASTDGLRRTIARHMDERLVRALAAEHEQGRRCWIGTTDLDAMLPVYWNLGEIAAAALPGSADLIRSLLLASSSIPGAFPPVRIPVRAAGQEFDELHADGGGTAQIFLYPLEFDMRRVLHWLGFGDAPARLYLIRNARLLPRHQCVEPRLLPILTRAVSSLVRTQGLGDVHRIFLGAQRDGLDFNLAHIPAEFSARPREAFDLKYMRELFELGRSMARRGYPWQKAPPGLSVQPL